MQQTAFKTQAKPGNSGRRMLRGMRRIILWIVVLIGGGLLTGLGYQVASQANDRRNFPPPGAMVDVGGYRLHAYATGATTNQPTIVLDAASGSTFAGWAWVQQALDRNFRVVSFDRPGVGYSDAPPTELSAQAYAEDLHQALRQVNAPPPYVLVGHSMGSLTSRAFASQYRDDVIAMVLVDPRDLDIVAFTRAVHPDANIESAEPTVMERVAMPLAARLGLLRLNNPYAAYLPQLPETMRPHAQAASTSTHHWDGYLPDAMLGERAWALLSQQEDLSGVPLMIVNTDTPDMGFDREARTRFTALHRQMAETISPNAEHRVIEGADHYSIITAQPFAAQVADAVSDVLAQR